MSVMSDYLPNLGARNDNIYGMPINNNAFTKTSNPGGRSFQSMVQQVLQVKKATVLPYHVEAVLHARSRTDLKTKTLVGQGIHCGKQLLPALERKFHTQLAWTDTPPDHIELVRPKSASSHNLKKINRPRKETLPTASSEENTTIKLLDIIENDPYNKITFKHSNDSTEVLPPWVVSRLEDSCRQARFALPSDYFKLEGLSPLKYLEKYTFLTRAQRRRYDNIFNKYMDKVEKVLQFDNLYPALNSMFANSLGNNNFYILTVALCIPRNFCINRKVVFAGICAFCERLFWSSYNELHENSFFVLGNNRSLLECADFNGLTWKIEKVKISFELKTLLFSLA